MNALIYSSLILNIVVLVPIVVLMAIKAKRQGFRCGAITARTTALADIKKFRRLHGGAEDFQVIKDI